MKISLRFSGLFLATLLVTIGFFAPTAQANHAWGEYHWARSANPFTLKLGDNMSSTWDPYLSVASSDWSNSTVLDTTIIKGQGFARLCRAVNGRVEVCNSKYGSNGWLGIATIWASGNHITQGTVKMNDTYFNTSKYNTPAWKQFVTCQEVGHVFGLNHQDETFGNPNLGTCMDYTSDPSTNQHPNQHDYDMLETIYAHLDGFTTILSSAFLTGFSEIDTESPSEWGRSLRESRDGRSSLYERDLGFGRKMFTFVIWAD
ncbi:MAG: hypothetical protein AAB343_00910 [Patescibacteria group bacterium]